MQLQAVKKPISHYFQKRGMIETGLKTAISMVWNG